MQEVCLLSVHKTTTERGDYEDGGCELKLKHCRVCVPNIVWCPTFLKCKMAPKDVLGVNQSK